MSKKQIDGESLDTLEDALARDMLDPATPVASVETYLREHGADPDELRTEGKEIVAQLQERRRLSWQEHARNRIARRRPLLDRAVAIARQTRDEMIAALHADERFAPVFRKRQPGDVSTEELRGFMEDLERLRLLEEGDDEIGGGE